MCCRLVIVCCGVVDGVVFMCCSVTFRFVFRPIMLLGSLLLVFVVRIPSTNSVVGAQGFFYFVVARFVVCLSFVVGLADV